MTPKQLHTLCDFFLLIPILGTLLSVFLFTNKLDQEMLVIKDMISAWKKKPVHILQDSYQKTCEDIGMNDIISYQWPGTIQGCTCSTSNLPGECNQQELQIGCENVEEIKQYRAKKWKTRYLCSYSTKSKSYFELSKVKAEESCSYKLKKCGIIDTLSNYLCVPESENCPLNSISFLNTVDEQHVRIDTSNSNEHGKIFSNFIVAEDKLCLNHHQREFSEKDFILINHKGKYLHGCKTSIYAEDGLLYDFDKNFVKVDSYPKKIFYEHNNIFPFVSQNVKKYPTNFKSDIILYASVFPGWKRECEKKEFHQFRNTEFDNEINDIVKTTDDFNLYLIGISISVLIIYCVGIIIFKYFRVLNISSRLEITNSNLIIFVIIYILITILAVFLFYFADVNLDSIKNAKLINDFIELLTNNECSDPFTNSILKNLTKEFYSYANRYFNIKMFSILTIIFSCFLLCISICVRPATFVRSKRRANQYNKVE